MDFELLQKLQELSELESFVLVGGTSLALQIGHRNSIDIDLFTRDTVDVLKFSFFYLTILIISIRRS
jgi:hypothetical protein